MERLTIENFAGLQKVSLETGPITVLIGPQATGKSVIAKLLYFFREILSVIRLPLLKEMSIEEYRDSCRARFFRYFPPANWGANGFSIGYYSKDEWVRITYDPSENKPVEDSLNLEWSGFYVSLLEGFFEQKQETLAATTEEETEKKEEAFDSWLQAAYEMMDRKIGPWAKSQQVFIPAGRAFFSQVQASVFRTLETGQDLDPFLIAFGAYLETSKNLLQNRGFFSSGDEKKKAIQSKNLAAKNFPAHLKNILRAEFARVENKDFVRYPDGRQVRLAQASSGQQEALPLLLVLWRFIALRNLTGRAVYIEEPEAHLFPKSQRHMVELMAETYHSRPQEMCIVVTTHSPYILTALNNLLQAGQRYSNASETENAKLQQIVPQSRALQPGEVAAYALDHGEANSIINETGLIDATLIDDVSTEIAVEFDHLLWDV